MRSKLPIITPKPERTANNDMTICSFDMLWLHSIKARTLLENLTFRKAPQDLDARYTAFIYLQFRAIFFLTTRGKLAVFVLRVHRC